MRPLDLSSSTSEVAESMLGSISLKSMGLSESTLSCRSPLANNFRIPPPTEDNTLDFTLGCLCIELFFRDGTSTFVSGEFIIAINPIRDATTSPLLLYSLTILFKSTFESSCIIIFLFARLCCARTSSVLQM